MDMNREGTVEGDDLPTEQDVAAVQSNLVNVPGPAIHSLAEENWDGTGDHPDLAEGEQTERKVMAAKAKGIVDDIRNHARNSAYGLEDAEALAVEIAAYLARQAE